VETIDEHVREVRNMFARVLGQPQDKPHKAKTTSKSTAAKKKKPGKRKTASAEKTRAKRKVAGRKAPTPPSRPKLKAQVTPITPSKKRTGN
jgi:putative phosphoserine phosphatase / 1-acylglycerol-3-phosphate O-acyltransferase